MAVSKAQQKAQNKWIAKAYDRVNLTLPKGQKEVVQAHAKKHGESVNAYINTAIAQRMERDSDGAPTAGPQEAAEATPNARVVSLPSETLEAAQKAAGAAGEAVPAFIARAVETQAQRDKITRRCGINPASTPGKEQTL